MAESGMYAVFYRADLVGHEFDTLEDAKRKAEELVKEYSAHNPMLVVELKAIVEPVVQIRTREI